MPSFFSLNSLHWRDYLDVLVVAVLAYYILLALRGTRAAQILLGIVVLLLFQGISFSLKLQSTYFVLRGLVLSILVAMPIVFQPELRRALMQLGGTMRSPFHHFRHDVVVKIVEEIAWAVQVLSQTHTGALIVIESETGLEEWIENGVPINAQVSSKLLLAIFQKTSPLHDGAVILRGDTVVAAACYLPLSEARLSANNPHSGTRHRAARGLSEQSDALVVVVSEETGDVSVVRNGEFVSCDSEEALKRRLIEDLTNHTTNAVANTLQIRWDTWFTSRRGARRVNPAVVPVPLLEVDDPSVGRPTPGGKPVEAVQILSEDEDIAEKQRQTEKAVEKRASEARRREERRRDDETRRPDDGARGDDEDGHKARESDVYAASVLEDSMAPSDDAPDRAAADRPASRPPNAGHAAPSPPRTPDSLQGRQ